MQTIPHVLKQAARTHGERAALVGGGETVSFAELDRMTDRAARAFIAAGLRKGDRVGVWAPNRCDWVMAAAGAQRVGGVLVPLNTRLKGAEVAEIVRRAGIVMLVSIGDFLGQSYPATLRGEAMPSLRRVVVLGDHSAAAGLEQAWGAFIEAGDTVDAALFDARVADVRPDDLADIMFTSGTTGLPKGAVFDHQRTLRGAADYIVSMGVTQADRFCAFGPFSHNASYKLGWVTGLACGMTVHWPDDYRPESVLDLIARNRITVMPLPPTVIADMLAHPARPDWDLSSLRYIATGATIIPVELIRRIREDLNVPEIATGYGMTECSGSATQTRRDDDFETIATTVGRALDGTEVRCVDAQGEAVPTGTPGEILIRNARVLLSYLDDAESTRKAIDADGWLHSGDVGTLDERGYLRITDRLKDMFIVGGFNVYPAEVERHLFGLEGVLGCAVVGTADQRLGEVGHAFIVGAPGHGLTEGAVIAWCRARMANYKVPRGVTFLDALPLNTTGKVVKFELRKLLG